MAGAVITNPVINSPFHMPERHFVFSDEGITDQLANGRRPSSYFVPIPQPKKKSKDKQLVFDTEWTRDRIQPNDFVNRVRPRVDLWRARGSRDGITRVTQRLLDYWRRTGSSRRAPTRSSWTPSSLNPASR
jgi:type III restriction enzyme